MGSILTRQYNNNKKEQAESGPEYRSAELNILLYVGGCIKVFLIDPTSFWYLLPQWKISQVGGHQSFYLNEISIKVALQAALSGANRKTPEIRNFFEKIFKWKTSLKF